MTSPACPSYAGFRFPAEVISHAVWLYFRFPLSLRMVDELLAARGIFVSHERIYFARHTADAAQSDFNIFGKFAKDRHFTGTGEL